MAGQVLFLFERGVFCDRSDRIMCVCVGGIGSLFERGDLMFTVTRDRERAVFVY